MSLLVQRRKHLLGKLYWVAKLGAFEAEGTTKSNATLALYAKVEAEPEKYEPYVRVVASGEVWTLWREPGSWCYRTPSGSLTVLQGSKSRGEAISMFDDHIAQYYA